MSHDTAMLIKAKDTATLNGTPENALIALTDRSRRRADTITLRRKTPRCKLRLNTWNHHQAFRLTSEPYITIAVFLDTPNFCGIQIQAVQTAFHTNKFLAAFLQQEETISTRTYIYITLTVLKGTTYHDVGTAKSRQVNVCINHHAITATTDAVLADNQNIAVFFRNKHDNALTYKKLMDA